MYWLKLDRGNTFQVEVSPLVPEPLSFSCNIVTHVPSRKTKKHPTKKTWNRIPTKGSHRNLFLGPHLFWISKQRSTRSILPKKRDGKLLVLDLRSVSSLTGSDYLRRRDFWVQQIPKNRPSIKGPKGPFGGSYNFHGRFWKRMSSPKQYFFSGSSSSVCGRGCMYHEVFVRMTRPGSDCPPRLQVFFALWSCIGGDWPECFFVFFSQLRFPDAYFESQPSIIIFLLPQFVRKQCRFCHSPGRLPHSPATKTGATT